MTDLDQRRFDRMERLRREFEAKKEARARRKEEIAAEKVAKAAKAKTCQICGRAIFAETGVIAHHGYQRFSGWQSQSCFGARHLPYEKDRNVLREWIGMIERDIDSRRQLFADVTGEKAPTIFTWTDYNRGRDEKHSEALTRHGWPWFIACYRQKYPERRWNLPASFDEVKQSYVKQIGHDIDQLEAEHRAQQKRYDEWKPVDAAV